MPVGIFSSGSVLAQQLLFRHSSAGDLTPLAGWYFDTAIGPKPDPASYARIAEDVGHAAGRHLFVSDVVAELERRARRRDARRRSRYAPGNTRPQPRSRRLEPPSGCTSAALTQMQRSRAVARRSASRAERRRRRLLGLSSSPCCERQCPSPASVVHRAREEEHRHHGVADHERPRRCELQRRVGERPLVGVHQARRPRAARRRAHQAAADGPAPLDDADHGGREQHRREEEALLEREGAVDPGVALLELADERLAERAGRRRRGRRRAGRSSPSARPRRRCRAAGRRRRPARARAAWPETPAR